MEEKYVLPKEKSTPLPSLQQYSILLYGQEKIGKTTLTANFPKPFHLMFEPGAKDLEVYKEDIRNWQHAKKVVRALESDTFYQNVIFDTADVCSEMIQKWVCEKEAVSDISDIDYGKGYTKIRTELADVVMRLIKSGKGVLFTSHEVVKSFKSRDGGEVDRIIPSMSKQARQVLEPLVDIWVYYRYTKGGGREFVIRGDDEVAAGHRLKNHFKGIDIIPGGKSDAEAYQNFLAGFENRLVGKAAPAVATKKVHFKIK